MIKKLRKNTKKLILAIIIILIIIASMICIDKLMIKFVYVKKYEEYVSKYAKQYEVQEELIYAIIKAESNFEPNAKSNKNAQGLMQLMYSTAQEIAIKNNIQLTEANILEPDININLGTKYISELMQKYECIELALAAYNAGSGNVDKWIKKGTIKPDGSDIENIPYKETNTYVRKILRDYKIYMELK